MPQLGLERVPDGENVMELGRSSGCYIGKVNRLELPYAFGDNNTLLLRPDTTSILTLRKASKIESTIQTQSRAYHNHTMSQQPRSQTSTSSRLSTLPSQKPRQLSHLHSQLAQLTANVSDLENLLRMTAVQAESMRGLGGYAGGM